MGLQQPLLCASQPTAGVGGWQLVRELGSAGAGALLHGRCTQQPSPPLPAFLPLQVCASSSNRCPEVGQVTCPPTIPCLTAVTLLLLRCLCCTAQVPLWEMLLLAKQGTKITQPLDGAPFHQDEHLGDREKANNRCTTGPLECQMQGCSLFASRQRCKLTAHLLLPSQLWVLDWTRQGWHSLAAWQSMGSVRAAGSHCGMGWRGRGGHEAAQKWRICAKAPGLS